MPYAAKATIEHEFITDHLNIYLTFRFAMNQLVMPDLTHWEIECDGVVKTTASSAWQDEFTLLLVSQTLATRPAVVKIEYTGPGPTTWARNDPNRKTLETTWHKQWEPWEAILSTDLTATLWKTGMILLWSGSVASIPSGWALCNGSNGTPDLRGKFIIAAGGTYNPADTGGAATHGHTATQAAHTHAATQAAHNHALNLAGGVALDEGTNILDSDPLGQWAPSGGFFYGGFSGNATPAITVPNATPAITVAAGNNLPPYYALCYIMKL